MYLTSAVQGRVREKNKVRIASHTLALSRSHYQRHVTQLQDRLEARVRQLDGWK